jgi:hypothetical protein
VASERRWSRMCATIRRSRGGPRSRSAW